MGLMFQVTVQEVEGPAESQRLGLRGRLALDTAREARQALLGHVRNRSVQALLMDLSALEDLDTAGAAVLAETLREATREGKRLVLCQPSEAALKIFRLGGFEELLACCCDEPAGEASGPGGEP